MSSTYCVWYRIKAADAAEAETVIRAMQARLACRTGIAGRLLKKRDITDTWMELYDNVAEPRGFERALHELAERYDVEMFLSDRRHVECFLGDAEPAVPACAVEGD